MKKLVLLAFFTALSSNLFAADGSSGCGAGWYVFKENSLISSALRASTNATFFSTVGMTFGTSNCAKHKIVQKEKEAVHFAEANYDTLMIEMGQGQGEFMAALSGLVGCTGEGFGAAAQANYTKLFNENVTDGQSFYQNFKGVVMTSADLAKACGVI